MTVLDIYNGSHQVVVSFWSDRYYARLFVNYGKDATLCHWEGKTIEGAKKWAASIFRARGMSDLIRCDECNKWNANGVDMFCGKCFDTPQNGAIHELYA